MPAEPLFIRKTRSSIEILIVSTNYMAGHARSLLGAICMFALPFILFSTLASYILTGNINAFSHLLSFNYFSDSDSFVVLLVAYLVFVGGIGVLNLTINKHMLLTEEPQEVGGNLWNNLTKNFVADFKIFVPNFLIIFICYTIIPIALKYFLDLFESLFVSYDDDPRSVSNYILIFIVRTAPHYLVLSLALFIGVATAFVSYRDKTDAWESVKKVWMYTKTKLKKAWLSAMLSLMITFVFLFCFGRLYFYLGLYTGFFGLTSSPILFYAFSLIQTAINFIIVAYFQIAAITLFGSLEDETEGYFIKSKIEKV